MAKVKSMSSILRLHIHKKGPVCMRPERDTCISESVIQVRGERLCTLNSFKLSSSEEPCLSSAENPGPECVKSQQVGITGSHFTSSDWPLLMQTLKEFLNIRTNVHLQLHLINTTLITFKLLHTDPQLKKKLKRFSSSGSSVALVEPFPKTALWKS